MYKLNRTDSQYDSKSRVFRWDNSTSHNKPKTSEDTVYVDETLIHDIIAQANGDKNEHVVIQNLWPL